MNIYRRQRGGQDYLGLFRAQTKEVNIAQVPKNSNPQSKTGTSQRQKELHQL